MQLETFSKKLTSQLEPENTIDQDLVRKGMYLCRMKHVSITEAAHKQVESIVNSDPPASVQLDFNGPFNSKCTCKDSVNVCEHIVAVFFHLYNKEKSMFDWVQSWKKKKKNQDILSALRRGSDLLSKKTHSSDISPARWIETIRAEFQQQSPPKNPFQFEEWAKSCFRRIIKNRQADLNWQALFQLFAAVESVKQSSALWAGQFQGDKKMTSRLRALCGYFLAEAESAAAKLNTLALPFAFDEFILYLSDSSYKLLNDEAPFQKGLIDMYFFLWLSLFSERNKRKKELKRLLNRVESPQTTTIGIIHLALLLKDDELALKKIKSLGAPVSPYTMYWLNILLDENQKDRHTAYLPVFLDQITAFMSLEENKSERTHFTQLFFQTLNLERAVTLDSKLMDKVYRSLLPHSRYQYAAFLLKKRNFKRWAELQASSLLFNLDYIERSTVELIAKHEPSILYPLYHNTILDLISSRKRPNYERAVQYLIELRTYYQRENLDALWEKYFTALMGETKRLRAFQEECKKGNLFANES